MMNEINPVYAAAGALIAGSAYGIVMIFISHSNPFDPGLILLGITFGCILGFPLAIVQLVSGCAIILFLKDARMRVQTVVFICISAPAYWQVLSYIDRISGRSISSISLEGHIAFYLGATLIGITLMTVMPD